MKIGIDARLINQTGVGRYIRNLQNNLLSLDKKNQYCFFQLKIKWHTLAEQLILPLWLIKKNFDLVHFTYFSLPILYPKKFIVTIHDLIPWHFKTGLVTHLPPIIYKLKYFFYKLVLWIGVRRAVKIITVSQVTKKEIIDHLKIEPKKIAVIYEGVNKKFQIPIRQLADKFQINPKINIKNYFLYVGNAYPHKNLMNLIEAFKQLNNETMKQFKLILVGPDDYFYQKLKAWVIKKSLQDKIIFYGPASDEKLISLYNQAVAFINPSLMEGFGLPGLEAMVVGCPVICSNIASFREIYSQAAIYFDPRDIRDIREKITKFLVMPEKKKQELINLGRVQASKYSWEQCARQTLEVYESCIGL